MVACPDEDGPDGMANTGECTSEQSRKSPCVVIQENPVAKANEKNVEKQESGSGADDRWSKVVESYGEHERAQKKEEYRDG